MQTTVRVDREFTAKLHSSTFDKIRDFATLAEPQSFQLQQDHIGKTVVDLGEINILQVNVRHLQRLGSRETQANDERIGPSWNIVRWIGMPFSNTGNIHWRVLTISGLFYRRDHNGTGTVSLQAAVEQTERFRYP